MGSWAENAICNKMLSATIYVFLIGPIVAENALKVFPESGYQRAKTQQRAMTAYAGHA
jgi:hypothetical protein